MTRTTNRNNIKPMLWLIAFVVVVLLCWFRAIMTKLSIRARQFSCFNCVIYGTFGLHKVWIFGMITFFSCQVNLFSFFSLTIMFLIVFHISFPLFGFSIFPTSFAIGSFAFFGLLILLLVGLAFSCFLIFTVHNQQANLAIYLNSIFATTGFMKFRNWLDFLAFAASFCYELLRHGFSPCKKSSCLEPVAGYAPAVGSLYCKQTASIVNNNIFPIGVF